MDPFEREQVSQPDEQSLDAAVEEMLEGSERSEQWRVYIKALLRRRSLLESEFDAISDPEERKILEVKMNEIDEQIKVLSEEASITQFIENAVKYSYEVRRLSDG
jgi:hypothetical protein